MALTFKFVPLIPGQAVAVFFNHVFLERIVCGDNQAVFRRFTLPGKKSGNVIQFVYDDWNGRKTLFAKNDSRPLAVSFSQLDLSLVPGL
jgi:hypothetical protein